MGQIKNIKLHIVTDIKFSKKIKMACRNLLWCIKKGVGVPTALTRSAVLAKHDGPKVRSFSQSAVQKDWMRNANYIWNMFKASVEDKEEVINRPNEDEVSQLEKEEANAYITKVLDGLLLKGPAEPEPVIMENVMKIYQKYGNWEVVEHMLLVVKEQGAYDHMNHDYMVEVEQWLKEHHPRWIRYDISF